MAVERKIFIKLVDINSYHAALCNIYHQIKLVICSLQSGNNFLFCFTYFLSTQGFQTFLILNVICHNHFSHFFYKWHLK